MTNRYDWFVEFQEYAEPSVIRVGNGEEMIVQGEGSIDVETIVNEKYVPCTIFNVLYVPGLLCNLFSVKKTAKKGINFTVDSNGERCIFTKNNEVIAVGAEVGSLYKICLRVILPKAVLTAIKPDSLQLWHERLAHQNKRHVKSY